MTTASTFLDKLQSADAVQLTTSPLITRWTIYYHSNQVTFYWDDNNLSYEATINLDDGITYTPENGSWLVFLDGEYENLILYSLNVI